MPKIDYSKAPAGATHWDVHVFGDVDWYRFDGCQVYRYSMFSGWKGDHKRIQDMQEIPMDFRKPMPEPCAHCGGQVDENGWRNEFNKTGPQCRECGVTAPDMETWNRRV